MSPAQRRFDEPALLADDVESVVADRCFPERADERVPGRVGLEVERFPIRRDAAGQAAGRLVLADTVAALQPLVGTGLTGSEDRSGVRTFGITGGGQLTFEPGGQIEHVSEPHDTAAAAQAEVEAVGALLAESLDAHGVSLASAGVDVWHPVREVPLQLGNYRYEAMDAYLSSRSSVGPVMMRHTCSLQINLDLGPESQRADRWVLANLVSPLLTATFAASPAPGLVCSRADVWQTLDPTRTGFPRALVDGTSDDPVRHVAEAALDADVLIVRTGAGSAAPGKPGWTFHDWLRNGHPTFGPPTTTDLRYHLSTVFLEVRPRGRLEFRGIDALPHTWRMVPVTLLVGALEDIGTRHRLRELLEPHRPHLGAMWRRAARSGVADPAFCAIAVEAWSYALEGASRLPAGYLGSGALQQAEAFLERFTLRGRAPADELRSRMMQDSREALAWAAEPVPSRTSAHP